MEHKKEFNQNEYINEYRKKHYHDITVRTKHDVYDTIENYCSDKNISKNSFMQSAALYVIENNIPLSEYYKKR